MHKGQKSRQRQKEINRSRRKEFAEDRTRGYLGIDKMIHFVKIMTV